MKRTGTIMEDALNIIESFSYETSLEILKDNGYIVESKPWGDEKGRIKHMRGGKIRLRVGAVHGEFKYADCIDFEPDDKQLTIF